MKKNQKEKKFCQNLQSYVRKKVTEKREGVRGEEKKTP